MSAFKIKKILLFVAIAVLLFLLIFVFVETVNSGTTTTRRAGIVKCGLNFNDESTPKNEMDRCTICDLVALASDIVNYFVSVIVPAIATLLFLFAGFLIILGGATPSQIQTGKTMFKNTVYGLLIIYSAWMIANTILKSLAGDRDISDNWYRVECVGTGISGVPGGGTTPTPILTTTPTTTADICSNPEQLAREYGVIFPRQNSQSLNQLIQCVSSYSAVWQLIDQAQIFTFERDNNLCNYTRGEEICGNCAHTVDSCHYGGRNGTQGAEAVDFNAIVDELQLYNELKRIESACNMNVLTPPESGHSHVSTTACSGR